MSHSSDVSFAHVPGLADVEAEVVGATAPQVKWLLPEWEDNLVLDHGIIGVSPFNSYFSQERIHHLAHWALKTFSHVNFVLPGAEEASYNLIARGWPEGKARRKCRNIVGSLHRKVITALSAAGVSDPSAMIQEFSELADNSVYRRIRDEADILFAEDDWFRSYCLEIATETLLRRDPETARITTEQAAIAAQYFLAEIPVLVAGNEIYGKGTSTVCYHREVPFVALYLANRLPWPATLSQRFAVVEHSLGCD
ncbi:tRNA-dependent cyclodipeptide synthase [Streptomyces sp. QTS52]